MGNKSIHGVIVPLITPVNDNENVQWPDLETLVEHVIEGGVDAIFAMGTTGEFARFDDDTRAKAIDYVVKCCAGRVPVYAGVSDCGTKRVLENIKKAEQSGVNAVVATLPYYFPTVSAHEALSYFRDIARSTSLPVILYNIPVTVGAKISLEVFEQLLDVENIVAMKDSSGDLQYFKALIELCQNRKKALSVIVGNESVSYDAFTMGADGIVPSLANPYPRLFASLYESAINKNLTKLQFYCDIVNSFNTLNNFSDSWMSPNIWRKVALELMGIISSCGFTQPYTPVSPDIRQQVLSTVEKYRSLFG